MTNISSKASSERQDPHWIEWATGIVSLLVVLAMIGWVTKEALTQEDMPPNFAVTVTGTRMTDSGYLMEIEIANTARQTAAAVVVRGEIMEEGRPAEQAEATFDYVAAQSKASGAIIFSRDPGSSPVRIRAVSYADP